MNSLRIAPKPSAERRLFAFFREELTPSPTRWRSALRLTLICLLGLVVVTCLGLPDGMYLIIFLFAVNMPDAWPSVRKAWIRGGSTILGGALALLVTLAFADQPWFLMATEGVVIAATLFLCRTTTIPYAVIFAGFTFLLLVPNLSAAPTASLSDALWRIALTSCGAVLGTFAQLVLWPDNPERQLIDSLAVRCRTVAEILDRVLNGAGVRSAVTPTMATQLATQLDLLASAEARSPWLRQRHPQQSQLITSLERLLLSALRLEQQATANAPVNPTLRPRLEHAREECLRLGRALEAETPPAASSHLEQPLTDARNPSAAPVESTVIEIEQTLREVPALLDFLGLGWDNAAPWKGRLGSVREPIAERTILTPACSLKNIEAVRYGLKGALAAMICYLICQGLNWPALSTSVAVCVLVAQSTFGAGVNRSLHILGGALFGGLSAIGIVVFLMPNLGGAAPFIVAYGVLLFIAAWINQGSSRISYLGVQIVMASSLVLLATPGPTVELSPARDRLVGVLLGISVMSAVDLALWPGFAGSALRRKLQDIVRDLASMSRGTARQDWDGARQLALGAHRQIAAALNLYSEWQLEVPSRKTGTEVERQRLLNLTHRTGELFLALLAVLRRRIGMGSETVPANVQQHWRTLDQEIAQRLENLVSAKANFSQPRQEDLGRVLGKLRDESRLPATSSLPNATQRAELEACAVGYRNLVVSLESLETDAAILRPTSEKSRSPMAASSPSTA